MIGQTARSFRIFVSSTFNDLESERNALQERVFPRLHELCQHYGARFQAIDLRWGVSDEATLDQQTMKICLGEIARCQRVTARPNFLILLGDRYGWRPLPYAIPATEFDLLLPLLTESERALACWQEDQPADEHGWYRRDDNAVPPEYILLPRQPESRSRHAEYTTWRNEVERPLLEVLERAARQAGLGEDALAKYAVSATEQEIIAGALKVRDAEEHVFGFFREIEGLPQDNENFGNTDADDPQKQKKRKAQERAQKQEELKGRLRERLRRNIHEYTARWQGDGPSLDHLDKLCEDVFNSLSQIIEKEIKQPHGIIAAEEENIHIQPDAKLDAEGRAHRQFAEEHLHIFVGREDMLVKIADYLADSQRHCLAIVGAGGSGKSSLMARAIQQTQESSPKAEIVYRFIGVTPGSSDGCSLLDSLCREISRRYGVKESDVPTDYRDLVPELGKRIRLATVDKPLILLLDSLDQLSASQDARSLIWVPSELPEHVFVIASTREEDTFENLKAKQARLVKLGGLSWQEGDELLSQWLASVHRTLQTAQRKEVLDKFVQSEGNPLYLKLAFEEARLWNSYQLPKPLEPQVKGIIEKNLIEHLESEDNHGKTLVSHALGYLAASRYGLAEDELLDLLSRDLQVYEWFFRKSFHFPQDLVNCTIEYSGGHLTQDVKVHGQSSEAEEKAARAWLKEIRDSAEKVEDFLREVLPKVQGPRLPVVLWSRLLFDLQPYLIERLMDGSSLLNFYHRELGNAATTVFLTEDRDQPCHERLADYFRFKADPNADRTWTGNYPRGLSELPYHLTKAKNYKEVYRILTDFKFLEAKVLAQSVQSLIDEYDLVGSPLLEIPVANWKNLRFIRDALRLSAHVLANDKDQLASQLSGRLVSSKELGIRTLLKQIKETKKDPWLRTLTLSLTPPGGALVCTLTGHTGNNYNVKVTPDGRRAVSIEKDNILKVWDLERGIELFTLKGHTGVISDLSVTPDGRLVSWSQDDHTFRVWDLGNGMELVTLKDNALSSGSRVAMTPDGCRAVSWSQNNTAKVWDLEHGTELFALKGQTGSVSGLSVTSDGQRLISWSQDDHTLKVWDLENGIELVSLKDDTLSSDSKVAVTPNGHRAIFLSDSKAGHAWMGCVGVQWWRLSDYHPISVWDLERGTQLARMEVSTGLVNGLSVAPDGRRIIWWSSDDTFKVWNWENGPELISLEADMLYYYKKVAVTPDGHRAISLYGRGGPVTVWDLERGVQLTAAKKGPWLIGGVMVTPDSRLAISWSFERGNQTLRVWNLVDGKELAPLEGHTGQIITVAMTPDGHRLVSGAADGTFKVWNISDYLDAGQEHGMESAPRKDRKELIDAVWVTPDRHRAISVSEYNALEFWDIPTPPNTNSGAGTSQAADGLIHAMAVWLGRWSGGRRAILGSWDDTIIMLPKGSTRCCTRDFPNNQVSEIIGVKVTPDGRRIISWSNDKTLRVWDVDSSRKLFTLKGHKECVYGVAITPDGRRLISGSRDTTLKVWDLKYGIHRTTLKPNHLEVHYVLAVDAVAVTPDGRYVVSGTNEGTIKVWDLQRSTQIAALEGHTSIILSIAITPDGRRLISGSADNTLKVWDLVSYKLLATFTGEEMIDACAVAPDGLTIAAADFSNHVFLLHLENIVSGPSIVTAWRNQVLRHLAFWSKQWSSLPAFGCPHCRTWSEFPKSTLGSRIICPNCGKSVKLNPFTIKGDWQKIAEAWKAEK